MLNGKKRKINRSDFEAAFKVSDLNEKVIENLYGKFRKIISSRLEFIDCSFLLEEMKTKFKRLIKDKMARL